MTDVVMCEGEDPIKWYREKYPQLSGGHARGISRPFAVWGIRFNIFLQTGMGGEGMIMNIRMVFELFLGKYVLMDIEKI